MSNGFNFCGIIFFIKVSGCFRYSFRYIGRKKEESSRKVINGVIGNVIYYRSSNRLL